MLYTLDEVLRYADVLKPMISVFSDRIEILSRGTLAPAQTMEGFFLGESIPVNEKLSEMVGAFIGMTGMPVFCGESPHRRLFHLEGKVFAEMIDMVTDSLYNSY